MLLSFNYLESNLLLLIIRRNAMTRFAFELIWNLNFCNGFFCCLRNNFDFRSCFVAFSDCVIQSTLSAHVMNHKLALNLDRQLNFAELSKLAFDILIHSGVPLLYSPRDPRSTISVIIKSSEEWKKQQRSARPLGCLEAHTLNGNSNA